jgi:hypothetical protein
MLSYRIEGFARYPTSGFASVWRPTSVCSKKQFQNSALDMEQLVRAILGFALAFVAAACYMKLIPCTSIVVAAAVSAKIASVVTGHAAR